jgi:CheY-like chemotaxis protein
LVLGGFGLLVLALVVGIALALRRHRPGPALDGPAGQRGVATGAAAISAATAKADGEAAVLSPATVQAELAAHAQRLADWRAARNTQAAPPWAVRDAARQAQQRAADRALAQARGSDLLLFRDEPLTPAAPRTAALEAAGQRQRPPGNAAGSRAQASARPRHDRPPRILVVDDSRMVRVKLSRLFTPLGWQVSEAVDGDQALQQLQGHGHDLVVTDVDMPGLDGFALTRAIRAQRPLAHLPVVMISGSDDRHRDEAASAGVDILLGKPFGEAALLAHVRRLLAQQPEAAEAA